MGEKYRQLQARIVEISGVASLNNWLVLKPYMEDLATRAGDAHQELMGEFDAATKVGMSEEERQKRMRQILFCCEVIRRRGELRK